MVGHISQSKLKFLTKDFPTVPIIYASPKMHTFLENPPRRHIVACNDCLTEPIFYCVDRIIRPIILQLPSSLRDTGDFIKQLSELDIGNNYSEISHYFGCGFSLYKCAT